MSAGEEGPDARLCQPAQELSALRKKPVELELEDMYRYI